MSGDDEGPYSGPTIVTTLEGGRFTVWPGCRYILILTATRALLNTTFKVGHLIYNNILYLKR